ncbi:MAG: DUF4388 domain-containing protein [Anaerolineales bacterium]
MAEALRGDLNQFSLPNIIQLLKSGGQTGKLDLSDGSNSGEIFLENGNIVHAIAGVLIGEDAFYSLLSWLHGDFNFVSGIETPEETISTSTDLLLAEGEKRIQGWSEIKNVIPSMQAIFNLAEGTTGAINLDPNEWKVLAQVNGVRTITDIAASLGWDEFEAASVLAGLVKTRLLEIVEESKSPPVTAIDNEFFDRLNDEFIEVIGPVGPVIIDEKIASLNETRESFPRNKVADLVEQVSTEIEDADQRMHFQQIMLDLLRGI